MSKVETKRRRTYTTRHVVTAHLIGHAIWLTIVLVAVFGFGFGSGFATKAYVDRHGGAIPAPQETHLPPVQDVGAGARAAPSQHSLKRWVVRIHDQGNTESCGCQVSAEDAEIVWAEHTGTKIPLSSGYVCALDHFYMGTGLVDAPTSIEANGHSLGSYGDSTLGQFWPDGTPGTFGYSPNGADETEGEQRLFRSQIRISDQASLAYYISHGMPVAVLRPIYSTLFQGSTGLITSNSGDFQFWHFMLIVGYQHGGGVVTEQQSWGQSYGSAGFIHETWDSLTSGGAMLFVNIPSFSITGPPRVNLARLWSTWGRRHHRPVAPYRLHHHLSTAAKWWLQHRSVAGFPAGRARTHRGRVPYFGLRFTRGTLYYWNRRGYRPRFVVS